MRFYFFLIIISISNTSFSQIDNTLFRELSKNSLKENKTFINSLKKSKNDSIYSVGVELLLNTNLITNIETFKYRVNVSICDDSTCEIRTSYSYCIQIISNSDTVIKSNYQKEDNLPIKLNYVSFKFQTLLSDYLATYGQKLDTVNLFRNDKKYSTNIGVGSDELSLEMKKIITAIKTRKYKTILCYLKSQFPEQRLYGLLGVEIIKQKKIKIPPDILKYYEISKNTKGKVYNCEGDMCALDEFQSQLQKLPSIAKVIIQMHSL